MFSLQAISRSLDVLTTGSAVIDIVTTAKGIKPDGNSKLKGLVNVALGGGGANTAAILSSLGWNAKCLAAVGKDDFAPILERRLEDAGVELLPIRNQYETGRSIVLVNSEKETRTCITHFSEGVKKGLTVENIMYYMDRLRSAHLLVLNHISNDVTGKFCKKIMIYATKANVFTAWNIGSTQIKAGIEKFSYILGKVSLIQMNMDEARRFTGLENAPVTDVIKVFRDRGAIINIITLDDKGAMLVLRGKSEVMIAPAFIVPLLIDTTGSGDAHISGFLHGFIRRGRFEDGLLAGAIAAGFNITGLGGTGRPATLDEMTIAMAAKRGEFQVRKVTIGALEYALANPSPSAVLNVPTADVEVRRVVERKAA